MKKLLYIFFLLIACIASAQIKVSEMDPLPDLDTNQYFWILDPDTNPQSHKVTVLQWDERIIHFIDSLAPGSGDIYKSGSPSQYQLVVWDNDSTISGMIGVTFDGFDFDVDGNIVATGDVEGASLNLTNASYAGKLFYINGSGEAVAITDGSNGDFLSTDGSSGYSFSTPIKKSGSPSQYELAAWADANTVYGIGEVSFDGTDFDVLGNIIAASGLEGETLTINSASFQNKLVYFNSSGVMTAVPSGTVGQLLQDDGDGTFSFVTASGSGDMTKAVYDTDDDGDVDDSELLQGNSSSYHLSRSNHTGTQAASTIGSGTFADARISESSVTQHESALSVAHTQVTDYDTELAGKTNTTAFTPTSDYHPATKKYVDDEITAAGGYNDEAAQDAIGTILVDGTEIDFTYSDATPSITAAIASASIDETKLDASTNASLDLADSAVQPGDLDYYTDADIDGTESAFTGWDKDSSDDFDGDYDNLTNKPTIPTNNNELTNGAGYLTTEVDGSTSNEIQTIDVSSFDGTNISLSLSSDGEATKTIDISSVDTDTQLSDEQVQDIVGAIVGNTAEINITYSDATPSITAAIASASIDETKLDASVNASLDLADDAVQPGDNVSDLTNDSGFITSYTVTTGDVTSAGAVMDSEVDADIKTLDLPASTTISTFGKSLIDDAAASNARTTLGLGSLSTASTVNNSNWSGTDLSVSNGGTGASTLTGIVIGNGTSAFTTITDNSSNWNTAYGWGDHTSLYLPLAGGTLSGALTTTSRIGASASNYIQFGSGSSNGIFTNDAFAISADGEVVITSGDDTSLTLSTGATSEPKIEMFGNSSASNPGEIHITDADVEMDGNLDVNTLAISGTEVIDASRNVDAANITISGDLLSDQLDSDESWDDGFSYFALTGADARIRSISTDAGTWGSFFTLGQLDLSEGTHLENIWGIGRQTNGDGGGNGSLYFTYGTDHDPALNTAIFRVNTDGTILSSPTYSSTVGGTNRDLYIDNTGLIGYVSSIAASKTNIDSLQNVDWLLDLNPVEFNYRKKNSTGDYTDEYYDELEYGLIAEEVEQVNDELVFYDVDSTGTQELRGVSYSKLVVPLLKLVQEQQAQIEALAARIEELED
ncbi:MAG: tail fiber domain-containing protein [Cyclobacteriaceae bacterium]